MTMQVKSKCPALMTPHAQILAFESIGYDRGCDRPQAVTLDSGAATGSDAEASGRDSLGGVPAGHDPAR